MPCHAMLCYAVLCYAMGQAEALMSFADDISSNVESAVEHVSDSHGRCAALAKAHSVA